jgi:hypothetical protein
MKSIYKQLQERTASRGEGRAPRNPRGLHRLTMQEQTAAPGQDKHACKAGLYFCVCVCVCVCGTGD